MTAHVCSFSALPDPPRGGWTYAELRAAVLKAGRFSVFEATAAFTRLHQDSEIETYDLGYPWTGVRLRERKDGSR